MQENVESSPVADEAFHLHVELQENRLKVTVEVAGPPILREDLERTIDLLEYRLQTVLRGAVRAAFLEPEVPF
jgi:hypothetical protein